MSGVEAIAVVGLIDACIGITKTILDIGRAVHDAQGLPPKLRDLFDKLPAIEDLLENAREACDEGGIDDDGIYTHAQPLLQQCETALAKLRDIIRKACPKDGDSRKSRIWKGTKTVFFGRDSQVQALLVVVLNNLKLLEQQKIYAIGDKLDELAVLTESLGQDDGGKYSHSGTGNILVVEGGTSENHVQGGSNNRMIIKPGVYHEGSSINHYYPPARPETPPQPSTNVPFRRDPDFVVRTDVTAQIISAMTVPAARLALVGLGGAGKSQIAIEYCHYVRLTSPETWVLWIHASNAARYEQSVRDIVELARIPGRSDRKADIYALFRNWLREKSTRKWLIVLDNADEVDFLVERRGQQDSLWAQLPICDQGTVLITSRSTPAAGKLVARSAIVSIKPMSKEQAATLLQKKLGPHAENEALAVALEYMPLAIAQAAAYIQQRGTRSSIEKYLAKLQKSDHSKTSILDEDAGDLRRDSEARNAIILTWQISFEHIRRVRRSAADLLSLMCFCDRQAIPRVLLRILDDNDSESTAELNGNIESSSDTASDSSSHTEEDFDKDIVMLEGFAFVSTTLDDSVFEMHRLVGLATQRWLYAQMQAEHWKKMFVRNLDDAFPAGSYEYWDACQMLLPHVRAAMNLKMKDRDALLHKASICYRGGWYARKVGLLSQSEEMCICSYDIRLNKLGSQDLETAWSMAGLASTYWNQGRWGEAEQLEVRVMETRKTVLGAEHPDTLTSMANLASTYRNQGRWGEAEQLDVRVMETSKTVLGAEHPDTLTSMANLASTYWNQGRWGEAEQLEVRVMETSKTVLGAEHPNTLTSMANLASTYSKQKRWIEAEELLEVAVKGHRRVFGPSHPDTETVVSNLYYVQQAREQEVVG